MKVIGVDIGSQKTMMVADDGDIILTDTGSINRPTLVAFYGKSRLVGEEAAPQISGDSTLSLLNILMGQSEDPDTEIAVHRRVALSSSSSGLVVEVNYNEKKETFSVTALLALFISKLSKRARAVYGEDIQLSFVLPPNRIASVPRAIKEACQIAEIDESTISFVDMVDSIVATYGRKLQALRGNERSQLENKYAVLIDMGHTSTCVVIVRVEVTADGTLVPIKQAFSSDSRLGCLHFDCQLFRHFASICSTQHATEISPGSKRGQRLLSACERARKLLSQLPDAKITVENLTDAGDVHFNIRRDDFLSTNAPLIERFKALLTTALTQTGAPTVTAVEIVGGGMRMPVLQQVITSQFGEGIQLGAKFDDASVALGAALLRLKSLSSTEEDGKSPVTLATQISLDGTIGLTNDEVMAALEREKQMQKTDAELEELLAARNALEAFLLEMRAAKRRKHGEKIDAVALEKALDESESWLWDNTEADLDSLKAKDTEVRTRVNALCQSFFEATERDRVEVERALDVEARKAEAEKATAGDADEDNDNRKLRKPERMRMVQKNKEEGTELFKGGNFRPAAARYHKALTHAAKFFDLTPADEAEVKAVKATLYLNLASCYLKLELWDQALRNCTDALELEPTSVKAFFRRASAYDGKKDWNNAMVDAKKCQDLSDIEDKLVTKLVEKLKRELQKEKDKEKKMWGKAFS